MKWELRYSESEFVINAKSENGDKLPDWYLDEPILPPWRSAILAAFWELNSERQIGMALGPIPHSRIKARAKDMTLGDVLSPVFVSAIGRLDSAYMKYVNTQGNKSG